MSTFIPYFYYPNRTSDTLIFVSPLGVVTLTTTIAIQIVASIVLVVASTFIFCCLKRRQREEELENEEIDRNISALQASIKKKGENSYYYAHQKKDDEIANQKKLKKTITKYSWTDQTKSVKVYIRIDDLPDIQEEDINLSWSSTSVDLTIKNSSGDNMCFAVKQLHAKINKAGYKRKENMITLSLEKSKKDNAWSTLHALKKHNEDNIEYDQSLYD